MYAPISIRPRHTPVILSLSVAAAVSNAHLLYFHLCFVPALSLSSSFSLSLSLLPCFGSLIPVPSTYTRLSLPRCSPSPSLVNSFRLFSSCIPFFVSPSRRNPLCPSRSCLLFLPLSFTALQFASARIRVRDAYSRQVTRTQAGRHVRTHARTDERTNACTRTSHEEYKYKSIRVASTRKRARSSAPCIVADLIGLYRELSLREA